MISSKDFFLALEALDTQKRITKEMFLEALEQALVIAYKKHSGQAKAVEVRLLPDTNRIKMFAYQTVVEEPEDTEKQISLEDARLLSRKYKVGDKISEEIHSKEFGRIAAQTARQVIMHKLRDVETEMAMGELSQKEDEIITAVVRRVDGKNAFVEINKLEASLSERDQLPSDRFNVGDKVKVYVKKIKQGFKGPQLAVTRTNAGFVRRLFENEVPEIGQGIVVIKAIVREAGQRTKMAVYSEDSQVDAVGACVGNRGTRVNSIVSELDGEKIDIIPWCDDPLEYIARSLSPAKVVMVQAIDESKYAKAIVADDMLSLAIGRDGQNARLAAKLTGWKIDVKPYSSLKKEELALEEAEAMANQELDTGNAFATDLDLGDLDDIGLDVVDGVVLEVVEEVMVADDIISEEVLGDLSLEELEDIVLE
ncbi:MAG: transcription termination factor NusA [Firmicutes bacterium]|nr:transcription termination factor NusA [Bacillota bacterium]